jgi:hypothetical protein
LVWAFAFGAQEFTPVNFDLVIESYRAVHDRCFAGCWNNLTFALWNRGVEILVDQVTMALTSQVRIFATLLCDVWVRYPSALAITAPVSAWA